MYTCSHKQDILMSQAGKASFATTRVSDQCSDTMHSRTSFLTNDASCHTHSQTTVSPTPTVVDVANVSTTHCMVCLLCPRKVVVRKHQ